MPETSDPRLENILNEARSCSACLLCQCCQRLAQANKAPTALSKLETSCPSHLLNNAKLNLRPPKAATCCAQCLLLSGAPGSLQEPKYCRSSGCFVAGFLNPPGLPLCPHVTAHSPFGSVALTGPGQAVFVPQAQHSARAGDTRTPLGTRPILPAALWS
ncbi:hypothetical protein KIL84_014099 [Mauremys mutica]|uniref:Uncharacterized protein n=1 Tax=Mauremys mutica TaxID=74926 RepID=A0A9D3XP36_9SAUR|nr:hypothetical protein KIL84_014099 [Mauremys mutica]